MKILHIVPSYIPAYRYGGPILSVHTLNKWLVRAGADVTVYTTNIDGRGRLGVPLNREVMMDGVRVWYFPITFAPWQYSCAMHKVLKEHLAEFDVVHITSVFLAASTLGAYYAKKYEKPYIISPRGSLMKEPLARKSSLLKKLYITCIERRNLAGAAAIHFTAKAEMEEYDKTGLPRHGENGKDDFINPNAFDPGELDKKPILAREDFKKKFGIGSNKKIILFMGRLSWKKGLDTLIPAFRQVLDKESNAILVLAGGDDEGYSKEIRKWMSENNLKESSDVVFVGMILGEEKAAALAYSDVFVLPSYSENFGMAVVEAMYMHLPVVVTENVALSQAIKFAGAGEVVDKKPKAVADAILFILKDPGRMGEIGRALVEKDCLASRVASAFQAKYNLVVYKK